MDWRDKLSGLKAELPEGDEPEVIQNDEKPKKQKDPLRVELDKRNGKPATLITEFQGSVVDACDGCIEIPQFGTKHSLNVSVTAGIVIWEFFRKIG